MVTDYKNAIDFSVLKDYFKDNGIKMSFVAEKIGIASSRLTTIVRNVAYPTTDTLARICSILRLPASRIVRFNGIEINDYFFDKTPPYNPPETADGVVTYKPLWLFLEEYLAEHKDKTADDLFDKIEPARRKNNVYCGFTEEVIQKALEARGITEGYEVKEKRNRRDYSSGLPYATRTKLRQDRPLNIRNIYDICKYLGCSIDFVMSYK